MAVVMWTWIARQPDPARSSPHRDSIPIVDVIKMLGKIEAGTRMPGTAIFLTSDPSVAPSSLMHNLKHNKVMHERVVMMCVNTETYPRVPAKARRFEVQTLSPDFVSDHAAHLAIWNPRAFRSPWRRCARRG